MTLIHFALSENSLQPIISSIPRIRAFSTATFRHPRSMRRPANYARGVGTFAIGCLLLATTASGQQPPNLEIGPGTFGRTTGSVAVPGLGYFVAAEPSRATELKPPMTAGGEQAFQENCTTCHDAQRSFQKRKTLAGWRVTVEKMAKKPDADIPENVREPIAKFLSIRAGAHRGRRSGSRFGGKRPGTKRRDWKEQGPNSQIRPCAHATRHGRIQQLLHYMPRRGQGVERHEKPGRLAKHR